MADIFYPGMPDWLDALNLLVKGQLEPIRADWTAAPGSLREILNKPLLAAVAISGSKGDVGLGAVDNTADADKPVSAAQAAALAGKASLSGATFIGPVAGISKSMVGLGNADNTSDASKPISTAQAAALAGKASLSGATFTGPVAGISKSMVGLGNADNTNDVSKPISTAQQAAFDKKVNSLDPVTSGVLTHSGPLNVRSGDSNFGSWRAGSASNSYQRIDSWDGSKVAGYIGTGGGGAIPAGNIGSLVIRSEDTLFLEAMGLVAAPARDGVLRFGYPTFRWSDSYFTVSPTITSDEREKDDFRVLSAQEIAAAGALARAIGVYRWKSAIALKGHEEAREHIGPTVQAAIAIMRSHGLDPFNYGFICHDVWDASAIKHEAVEAAGESPAQNAWTEEIPAGDRFGFRYDELNQFILAGLEARQTALEAQLATLLAD